MTTAGGEVRLGARIPGPPQRVPDRKAQSLRQLRRLIEAAYESSERMKGNGHDEIGALEDRSARPAHHRAQPGGERSPFVVLERVDDRAERSVVGSERARPGDDRSEAPASRAPGVERAERAPRRKRVAARIAERRRQRWEALPAGVADGPTRRHRERAPAGGADGRQQHRNQRIRDRPRPRRCAARHPRGARVNRTRASGA